MSDVLASVMESNTFVSHFDPEEESMFLLNTDIDHSFRRGCSQQNARWIWWGLLTEIKIVGLVWVITVNMTLIIMPPSSSQCTATSPTTPVVLLLM
jgi:hypothetical protein